MAIGPTVSVGQAARLGGAIRLGGAAKGVCGVLAAVALWELLRVVGVLPSDLAPSFADIVPALVRELFEGSLARAVLESVRAWATGFAVTLLIGLPIGIAVGLSRWTEAATSLTFDFLRPVPAVAFVPVAVIFFGLGTQMQAFLIAMAAVWPIIFNTRFGVRGVDPLLVDNARIMGLDRRQRVRRVVLPAALPGIFTGIRTAAAIAVVLTIVSELVAAGTGIGGFINDAQNNNLPAEAFAGVIVAGLFGYLAYLLVEAAESRATGWHRMAARRSE